MHHLIRPVHPVAAIVRLTAASWVVLRISLTNIGAAADRLLPAGHAK